MGSVPRLCGPLTATAHRMSVLRECGSRAARTRARGCEAPPAASRHPRSAPRRTCPKEARVSSRGGLGRQPGRRPGPRGRAAACAQGDGARSEGDQGERGAERGAAYAQVDGEAVEAAPLAGPLLGGHSGGGHRPRRRGLLAQRRCPAPGAGQEREQRRLRRGAGGAAG